MAYTKHTWSDGETITDALLNNMEAGIEANDKALASKANASALASKAAKGSNIAVEDAAAAGSETITKAEFDKVVAVANACKAELNKMNA